MKTFSTSGTGSQQTLSEIESDKIPIYNSLTDAEADLANLEEGQIIGTKDEGSELSAPVDTVQSGNMHAVTSNAVAEALSYSTTEHFTGMYWFDNKKIYEKSYKCATSFQITDGWQPIDTYFNGLTADISNIDTLVKLELMNTKNQIISGTCGQIESNHFKIATWTSGWNVSTTDGYLTILYTKTTD